MRPDGTLIGIETFGHNPFTNLKRTINQLLGQRTDWAVNHILKTEDFKLFKDYFNKTEIYFFHIISWLTFPFLNLPGGRILLRLLEKLDSFLLIFPFLRKYAFKVVFILSSPKK